jgi:hypothetical protein
MRMYRYDFDWDAPVGVVPDDAEAEIAAAASFNTAVRVTVDAPAFYHLRGLWDTLEQLKAQKERARADASDSQGSEAGLKAILP